MGGMAVLTVLRCARAARASAFGVPVRALRVARAAPCIEIRRCSVGKGTKWSVQSGGSALRTRFPAERCTAAAATRPMAVPVQILNLGGILDLEKAAVFTDFRFQCLQSTPRGGVDDPHTGHHEEE